jgi:citrate lyase gamma subunit
VFLILIFFLNVNGSSVITNIQKKLSSNVQKEFPENVQALIDRVLQRAKVPFRFVPILEIINFEEIDGL